MIQFVVQMTNSYGRRSVSGWSDVDDKEIRNYIGLLILAGVYRSKGESTRSLWDDQNKKITCDNFFTSFSLAQELLRKKVALVGTIRANKPELPLKLKKTKKRAVFSSLFAFTTTTTAVSYILLRGRNVLLLSTKHREPAVIQGDKQKPQIIVTYNCCKGGVDNLDKVCNCMLSLLYKLIPVYLFLLISFHKYVFIMIAYHSLDLILALYLYMKKNYIKYL